MAMIPQSAITAALTPIQREGNKAVRARQVQAAKNLQHAQDIEDLSDTGIDGIQDQKERESRQQQSKKKKTNATEENIDIEALKDVPLEPTSTVSRIQAPHPNLDISA